LDSFFPPFAPFLGFSSSLSESFTDSSPESSESESFFFADLLSFFVSFPLLLVFFH
jgi:hypothetical protein